MMLDEMRHAFVRRLRAAAVDFCTWNLERHNRRAAVWARLARLAGGYDQKG